MESAEVYCDGRDEDEKEEEPAVPGGNRCVEACVDGPAVSAIVAAKGRSLACYRWVPYESLSLVMTFVAATFKTAVTPKVTGGQMLMQEGTEDFLAPTPTLSQSRLPNGRVADQAEQSRAEQGRAHGGRHSFSSFFHQAVNQGLM